MPANRIIDLVDAHNTAVVVDHATGISYAVDSWFFDNGTPAVVLPLVVWRSGWDPQSGDTVPPDPDSRSEEHTSELQPLMRISYAVFCLKKKKKKQTKHKKKHHI